MSFHNIEDQFSNGGKNKYENEKQTVNIFFKLQDNLRRIIGNDNHRSIIFASCLLIDTNITELKQEREQ